MARDEMIEITAELRPYEGRASWAVWQGDYEEFTEKETGAVAKREKWIFLPKKCCRQGEAKNEWLVPEWLAQEKGLI